MQLPASYLLNTIKQYLDFADFPDNTSDFPVNPPSFYQGERRLLSHMLYLAQGSDLTPDLLIERGAILLYSGNMPSKITSCVYRIRDGISLFFLSNTLQNLFFQMENWEHNMADVVLKRGTLKELLRVAAAPLHNPLGIMNTKFQIIAEYSSGPIPMDDKEADSPDLRTDTVNSLKNDELYAAVEQYHKPFVFPAGSLSRRFLCVNLFYQDAFIGRLSMMEWKKEIQPWDSYFLEIIQKYVLPLFVRESAQSETQNRMHLLLGELLKGKQLSREELNALSQELNSSGPGPYICVCIYPSDADFENNTLEYFSRKLEEELHGTVSISFDDKIGLLGNLAEYDDKQTFEENLIFFIRESNFRAGIGRTFTDLSDAAFSYRQAEIALHYGIHQDPHIWKHEFDQYILQYLADHCLDEFPVRFLCSPGLLLLKKRDEETGSDLYHTLKTYISKGSNAVQAAKELSIHRGTLLYRLNKITELTGIDLNSQKELWYLSFSFLLAGYCTSDKKFL